MRVVICFSVFLCAVLCQEANDMTTLPKYDERYDYLDVDAIFNNKRLIRNYVDCLINSNRCTPEGKALKRLLPEALRTKCIRCTERQKRTAVKIINRLKFEFPDEWAKLEARWDPTGDFTRYFEMVLAKEHFNTIHGSENVIPLSVAGQPQPPRPTAAPVAVTRPAPVPEPAPALTNAPTQPPMMTTSPRPMILNRFGGDDDVMMGSPSAAAGATQPTAAPTMRPSSTMWPTTVRPKPSLLTWEALPSTMPTRFPLRPTTELPPPFSTAITFIDQLGYKIIRTTELVSDLLRNTVRVVVG